MVQSGYMKTSKKLQRCSDKCNPLLPPWHNSLCLQWIHHTHNLPPRRSQWKTPWHLMSNDISIHTLNTHWNQGLVQTILAKHLHHIYFFQEAAYTAQLWCIQTLNPLFPLGVWQDGYPHERGFLDYTNKRVCIYIDKNIDFLYAYEEVAGDIQIIHAQNKDNDRHAFSPINIIIRQKLQT